MSSKKAVPVSIDLNAFEDASQETASRVRTNMRRAGSSDNLEEGTSIPVNIELGTVDSGSALSLPRGTITRGVSAGSVLSIDDSVMSGISMDGSTASKRKKHHKKKKKKSSSSSSNKSLLPALTDDNNEEDDLLSKDGSDLTPGSKKKKKHGSSKSSRSSKGDDKKKRTKSPKSSKSGKPPRSSSSPKSEKSRYQLNPASFPGAPPEKVPSDKSLNTEKKEDVPRKTTFRVPAQATLGSGDYRSDVPGAVHVSPVNTFDNDPSSNSQLYPVDGYNNSADEQDDEERGNPRFYDEDVEGDTSRFLDEDEPERVETKHNLIVATLVDDDSHHEDQEGNVNIMSRMNYAKSFSRRRIMESGDDPSRRRQLPQKWYATGWRTNLALLAVLIVAAVIILVITLMRGGDDGNDSDNNNVQPQQEQSRPDYGEAEDFDLEAGGDFNPAPAFYVMGGSDQLRNYKHYSFSAVQWGFSTTDCEETRQIPEIKIECQKAEYMEIVFMEATVDGERIDFENGNDFVYDCQRMGSTNGVGSFVECKPSASNTNLPSEYRAMFMVACAGNDDGAKSYDLFARVKDPLEGSQCGHTLGVGSQSVFGGVGLGMSTGHFCHENGVDQPFKWTPLSDDHAVCDTGDALSLDTPDGPLLACSKEVMDTSHNGERLEAISWAGDELYITHPVPDTCFLSAEGDVPQPNFELAFNTMAEILHQSFSLEDFAKQVQTESELKKLQE